MSKIKEEFPKTHFTQEPIPVGCQRQLNISLKNADSSFGIYTAAYGDQPIYIQGTGAGSALTPGGLVADIVKPGERI